MVLIVFCAKEVELQLEHIHIWFQSVSIKDTTKLHNKITTVHASPVLSEPPISIKFKRQSFMS